MVWKAMTAAVFAGLVLMSPASAATITITPDSFDFGSVAVGDTTSHQFDVHTVGNPSEPFGSVSMPLIASLNPAFSVPSADNTCVGYGDCTITVHFSPTVAGLLSDTFLVVLFTPKFIPGFGSINAPVASFEVALSGTGISEVPLPAAFPLFATGLGVMGLLGWRRKRQTAAAA